MQDSSIVRDIKETFTKIQWVDGKGEPHFIITFSAVDFYILTFIIFPLRCKWTMDLNNIWTKRKLTISELYFFNRNDDQLSYNASSFWQLKMTRRFDAICRYFPIFSHFTIIFICHFVLTFGAQWSTFLATLPVTLVIFRLHFSYTSNSLFFLCTLKAQFRRVLVIT